MKGYRKPGGVPMKQIRLNKIVAVLIFCLCASSISIASDKKKKYGGIKLLPGYQIQQSSAVDASAWSIHQGVSGMTIDFESGWSEGAWAKPEKKENYSWYREQTVNGYSAVLALVKPGVKTVFEPKDSRGRTGNILLVTFTLDPSHPNYTANFRAKVLNQEELADALLMVLTFDPSKGGY
jgi:hypothetical protein